MVELLQQQQERKAFGHHIVSIPVAVFLRMREQQEHNTNDTRQEVLLQHQGRIRSVKDRDDRGRRKRGFSCLTLERRDPPPLPVPARLCSCCGAFSCCFRQRLSRGPPSRFSPPVGELHTEEVRAEREQREGSCGCGCNPGVCTPRRFIPSHEDRRKATVTRHSSKTGCSNGNVYKLTLTAGLR